MFTVKKNYVRVRFLKTSSAFYKVIMEMLMLNIYDHSSHGGKNPIHFTIPRYLHQVYGFDSPIRFVRALNTLCTKGTKIAILLFAIFV